MDGTREAAGLQRLAIPAALAALCLLVYWPVLDHQFVYDDALYITDNRYVNTGLSIENVTWAFREFHAGNWHPLTWLSHMVDIELFGMNPAGHHAVNLLLHAANSVLLYLVLSLLTRARWRSAVVAALFAIHPLHVESVAWAAARKDVLSALFLTLAIAAYAWYARRPSLGRYAAVVLALALGLTAKPMLVTLPFALLLLDVWPLERSSLKWRLVTEKIPLFALAAVSSVVTILAQAGSAAIVQIDRLPVSARVGNALLSYMRYLGKTVWPFDLAVFYPHPGAAISFAAILASLVFIVAVSWLAVSRLRTAPYFAVGWLWYLGTLVPVIGLVQVGKQGLADRYTYIPLVGIFIVLAWGAPAILARLRVSGALLRAAAVGLIAALAVLARVQVGYWRTPVTLYSHAVAATSANPVMESNLGFALMREGRNREAIEHLTRAVRFDPTYFDAVLNLGVALSNEGQFQAAFRQLQVAQAILPNDGRPHFSIGNLHLKQGNIGAAVAAFRTAIRLQPDNADFHNNLGVALMQGGESQEGTRAFERAVQLAPAMVGGLVNLAQALEMGGRLPQALSYYRRALELDPGRADARAAMARISGTLD